MRHTNKIHNNNDDDGGSMPPIMPMNMGGGNLKFPSILLTGVVNDSMVHAFHNFYKDLREMGHQRAIVYIDTPGGEVHALNAICNLMDTSTIEWHTVSLANSCSCGLLLLANGDVRYASDRSVLIFHDISYGGWGKIDEMKEQLLHIRQTSEVVLSKFAERTKKSVDWWLKQTKKVESRDFWFDSQQALDYGVVDYVGIPSWAIQPSMQGIIMVNKNAKPAHVPPAPKKQTAPEKVTKASPKKKDKKPKTNKKDTIVSGE